MELRNRLNESESPYLKEAAHQPVHWQVYSEEAFKLAIELDRPILLDIGAVWCHWCHVMDNESYTDPQVAELINSLYVPVKVDRDQMPDIDSRYQSAVSAIIGAGGWPLTGFLTPDGLVFYGGTYFPKSDMQGKPGLISLLPQIAEVYAKRRDDVLKSADEMVRYLQEFESKTTRAGEIGEKIIDSVVKSAVDRFDPEFGGFGTSPKFFNATLLLLLAEEAGRTRDPNLRKAIDVSLDRMAQGGVYDQIGGGFHRYSVDRYWHVPHFEKMLYDNALLLSVYLKNHEITRNELHGDIARETAEWITEVMRSPQGAFFAHQDADVGPNDDGSYWTWTEKEVHAVLTEEEFNALSQYFDVRKLPEDIHGFPERNVLRVAVAPASIASDLGMPERELRILLESAKRKLKRARGQRNPPFIDGTIFADRNGLAISALVEASLALKDKKYLEAAYSAAEFILENMVDVKGEVAHAYSGGSVVYQGLLDDQVYFGIALLDLFDAMRNDEHLEAAEKIAQLLLEEYEDKESVGFFDRPSGRKGEGLLSSKKKPIDDTPTPSGNSGAAILFDRLFSITENRTYYAVAGRTLTAFAGSADTLGFYVGNYARALRLHFGLRRNVR